MAKKRKQTVTGVDDEDGEWIEDTETAEAEVSAAPAEPVWYPASVLPPRGAKIEMDSCGDILVGAYDGIWRPDGSIRGVNVERWRLV